MPARKPDLEKPQVESDEAEFTITTTKGRKITFRELDVVQEFKLNSILGAQDSVNETVALHALIACMMDEVDGQVRMFPTTRQELEQAIAKLGRDGFKEGAAAFLKIVAARAEKDEHAEAVK